MKENSNFSSYSHTHTNTSIHRVIDLRLLAINRWILTLRLDIVSHILYRLIIARCCFVCKQCSESIMNRLSPRAVPYLLDCESQSSNWVKLPDPANLRHHRNSLFYDIFLKSNTNINGKKIMPITHMEGVSIAQTLYLYLLYLLTCHHWVAETPDRLITSTDMSQLSNRSNPDTFTPLHWTTTVTN